MEPNDDINKKIKENNDETLKLLRKKLINEGVKNPEKDVIYEMFSNACKLLEMEIN
jgi:aspartyl/asparaginyl beta-hydroxylase (cupin superfamily)